MLYPSVEIRWFFPGPPDRGLVAWFNQSHTAVGVGQRTDYYLLGVGEALNVKLREGRVEVKQRRWQRPAFMVNMRARGVMEAWTKWAFDLAEGDEALRVAAQDPACWLPVHKHRRQRTFITELDEITETAPGSYPSRGCSAELTVLRVSEQEWHTLAFEAFGAGDLPGRLHSVSDYLLDADLPRSLREADSMGYPAWIERNFVP